MAKKGFLNWVGFEGEQAASTELENQPATLTQAAPSNVARIRELEAELTDLRSRRDITSLTKEEFEILATETAISMIKAAQQRERSASALAEKVIDDSTRAAEAALGAAESKARTMVATAESKGRRLVEQAEQEAATALSSAQAQAEELLATKRRDAAAVTTAAKREADSLVQDANNQVSQYRAWLNSAATEAQLAYKAQLAALAAAENAVNASRAKVNLAMERLTEFVALQNAIDPLSAEAQVEIAAAKSAPVKTARATRSPRAGAAKQ
jgi:hypothetical protein